MTMPSASCVKCSSCTSSTTSINDTLLELNNLPYLDITSPVSNIPHLTNLDIDLNMPSDQNFAYYTTHDFHSNHDICECLSNPGSFSALYCNIRSLSANHDNLVEMLSALYFPFSLIGLSEIKLREGQDPLTNIQLTGYEFLHQPSLSNAGGVAFYIKNNFNFKIRNDITANDLEYEALWIEIETLGQPNMICGVIYRHPNGNLENCMKYIDSTIDIIHRENKLCLIMGDFNIDILKITTHTASDDILNSLGSFFFQPQILQPTRITDHSATLTDNIFLNSIEHFVISGNVVYDLSDHLPNFVILEKFSFLPSNVNMYRRDYSQLNELDLIDDFQHVNWQTVLQVSTCNDPSSMFDLFYAKTTEIIDKHIPVKELSRKEIKLKSKPWITQAIQKSINIKNKLYKKFLKTKSSYYHSKFKLYRNKLNHILKISKRKYYNNYFIHSINNSKRVWKGIKQIIHSKPKMNKKSYENC
jgi:hypothetical protein